MPLTKHVPPLVVALVAGVAVALASGTALVTAETTTQAPEAGALAPVKAGSALPPHGRIFVANRGLGRSTGSVTAYSPRASGNVGPVLTITKGVNRPYGLAFDASGDLWVANDGSDTLVEYLKGELLKASPVPSVTISQGPTRALNAPSAIAFDAAGNLWVDEEQANTVSEFAKSELAASGSPAPRVSIANASLFAGEGPYGLAINPAGDLWVEGEPNANTAAVCEYPRPQPDRSRAPAPGVLISLGYLILNFAFDASGNLWVPQIFGTVVDEYTKGELGESGSPPVHVAISGPALSNPAGVAFDTAGNLWVLSSGNDSLVEYTKAQLTRSGSPAPARTIEGPATGMTAPWYLAIEP